MSSSLPNEEAFKRGVRQRRLTSNVWRNLFFYALIFGLIALLLLAYNIVNRVFTMVAIENTVDPATLADQPLEDLSEAELVAILNESLSPSRMKVLIFQDLLGAPQSQWSTLNQLPIGEVLDAGTYPEALKEVIFSELQPDETAAILEQSLSQQAMVRIVKAEVVQPRVVEVWSLSEVVLNRSKIDEEAAQKYPTAELEFRTWINWDFLTTPMNSVPELAGLRTAILGSLWMMFITVLFAFPIGVGAALYLEEYATDSWWERLIELNISNLAGVPSIIYGILGLAVFVRALETITSGEFLGLTDAATVSGRTILSAGLTMALLILPIIIISAQEALRAVPPSLKEAAYGMGATKWQMIRTTLLPNAMPGILTGTILAVSRAFGETAPLVVVGSITRITVDPEGPFSRFTAIPIQIYTWTAQPQDEFRSIAGAAIIVLLVILLSMNSIAIVLRNRFSRKY